MPELRPRHDASPEEVEAIEAKLYAFNSERTGYRDGEGLGFVAEAAGVLVGAVDGYTWGGIGELRQVWVDAAHRHQGVGGALVIAALAEAERRGCRYVYLTTYDFQAPGFYRRLGFTEVAAVADKPLGHTEYVMRWSAGR